MNCTTPNDLAIILPIYNPHKTWAVELKCNLDGLINILGTDHNIAFVLVNDGSSVDISNEVKTLQLIFSNLTYIDSKENLGKGNAIRAGLKEVDANYYVYTDWDFPFEMNSVSNVFKVLKNEGVDLVVAERCSKYYKALPAKRKMISMSVKMFSFLFLGFNKYDTQAGLKGLSKKALSTILKTKIDSFIFELEFVKLAIKNNLSIATVCVDINPKIQFTNFTNQVLKKEIVALVKMLFHVR